MHSKSALVELFRRECLKLGCYRRAETASIFIASIGVVVRMCGKAMHSSDTEYAVTLTPVCDSTSTPVAVVVFTAKRKGTVDKVWDLPFDRLARIFTYRFPPLTVSQMLVALRQGRPVLLQKHCDAMELLEMGYRPSPN